MIVRLKSLRLYHLSDVHLFVASPVRLSQKAAVQHFIRALTASRAILLKVRSCVCFGSYHRHRQKSVHKPCRRTHGIEILPPYRDPSCASHLHSVAGEFTHFFLRSIVHTLYAPVHRIDGHVSDLYGHDSVDIAVLNPTYQRGYRVYNVQTSGIQKSLSPAQMLRQH